MIDAVIARLNSTVTALEGRVEPVLALAEMMRSGSLPETATAIVSPVGLQGGPGETGAGYFAQNYNETISVLLIARVYDQTGRRALAKISPLTKDVVEAVAGWCPDDEVGVFHLVRGGVVSLKSGVLLYQIEFSIQDELRIIS